MPFISNMLHNLGIIPPSFPNLPLLPLPRPLPHTSLQLLFQIVLGPMIRLVIDMDICALHIGQALELDLQFLSDVVRGAQGFFWVHDDVDFDDEAGARVVCADGVDLFDCGGVGHCCVLRRQYNYLKSGRVCEMVDWRNVHIYVICCNIFVSAVTPISN
jgi:hypothetical protein